MRAVKENNIKKNNKIKDIMANSQANMQWINLLHKKPNVKDV